MKKFLNSPLRWTIEIIVWTVATALVLALSILFPHLWLTIATVYLAVVSNYALVLSAISAKEALMARKAAENGSSSQQ